MAIKQVIVVRKDLNMSKGKIASQVSHACMKVFFDSLDPVYETYATGVWYMKNKHLDGWKIPAKPYFKEYIEGSFKKIVTSVNSLDELLNLHKLAQENNIHSSIIQDSTLGEYTALAIGPWEETKIDELTKELKLL
jgi:PTH2 family peptidyl-tRNA hydrolase